MRHCPECGAGVRREQAKYCEECGFGLVIDGATAEQATEPLGVASESSITEESAAEHVVVRIARPSPVLWWAVSGLGFAVFFPWLTGTARISNAMGVPVEFLWATSAPPDGLPVGWVLLGLAVLISITALVPVLSFARRLLGLVAVAIPIALIVQWARTLDRVGSADHWLSYIGVGVYAAFAAGAMALLAPIRRGA